MPKVGRVITDPRAGAYCQITLDSGERIIVGHDKGGFNGGMLTIELSKLMGLPPTGSLSATSTARTARRCSIG